MFCLLVLLGFVMWLFGCFVTIFFSGMDNNQASLAFLSFPPYFVFLLFCCFLMFAYFFYVEIKIELN